MRGYGGYEDLWKGQIDLTASPDYKKYMKKKEKKTNPKKQEGYDFYMGLNFAKKILKGKKTFSIKTLREKIKKYVLQWVKIDAYANNEFEHILNWLIEIGSMSLSKDSKNIITNKKI